jgi:hypothetical protein
MEVIRMNREQADELFKKVAQVHHTTPEIVRSEILIAMEEGQQSSDPAVQARWNAIPKKGDRLTIEEFLTYLISQQQQPHPHKAHRQMGV